MVSARKYCFNILRYHFFYYCIEIQPSISCLICKRATIVILSRTMSPDHDADIQVDKLGFHTSIHIMPTNQQLQSPIHQTLHTFFEAIRGMRICNYLSDISNFTSAFASNGYPLPLLQCQIHSLYPEPTPFALSSPPTIQVFIL